MTKSYKRTWTSLLLSCFFCLVITSHALAQEKVLTTQVTHLAGSNIYLRAGADDGIQQGDSLYVYEGESYLGSLVVQNVASSSLSADFAAEPFSLTRGQTVNIHFNKPAPADLEDSKEEYTRERSRTSILTTDTSSGSRRVEKKPRISGRISVGGNGLFTQTKWSPVQNNSTDRLFLTPNTRFRAFVTDLPSGLNLDASMAYSYRYSNTSSIDPAHYARFYRLNVEKEFTGIPLAITAGRFYNRYEIFSGFWDGVMARIGSRNHGIGLIAGLEPIRSDQGFQTDLPKYSAYTYHEFQWQQVRSSTEIDFTAIMPTNNLENHIFLGAYQQFLIDRHRISVRLQADRNPLDGQWHFSQLMARGALQLTNQFELHGGVNRRQPYLLYNPVDPVGYWRTEIYGGTRVRINSASLGADFSQISSELSSDAYSFSSYAQMYHSRFWDLGFYINGQYWFNDRYDTIRLAPGINRDFRNIHLGLGYEFYQSNFVSSRYQTHGIDLSAMINLSPKLFLQMDLRSGYSDLFINNSFQFNLWRSF